MSRVAPAATRRFSLPEHVVIRSFVSETILLDVENGLYYRLDATRGAMLECLLETGAVTESSRVLSQAGWGPGVELVAELTALCAELEELSLLRWADA